MYPGLMRSLDRLLTEGALSDPFTLPADTAPLLPRPTLRPVRPTDEVAGRRGRSASRQDRAQVVDDATLRRRRLRDEPAEREERVGQ